jgi:hypothetical protein
MTAAQLWELIHAGSDELAELLGLEGWEPRATFAAVDAWLAELGPLDEDDGARLGLLIARVLVEAHGGGLLQIAVSGHALDGEWAITGFTRGLASDYHVPFVIAAARIGVDRSITAVDWYAQCLKEGK